MGATFDKGANLHLVRYGTSAEQKHLMGDFLDTYDVLVINANMVSHTPSALAAFIGQKAGNKCFVIDPQTHAFQHDIALLQGEDQDGNTRLRKSIEKLVKAYGEPVLSRVNNDEVVLPEDFKDPGVVRQFAINVGTFQLDLLHAHAEEQGLTDYYDFVGVPRAVTPRGVVAPYFYMESRTFTHWLPVNLDLIQATAEQFGKDHEVYAQLVIAKDMLYKDEAFRRLGAQYAELPVSAVMLWVDDFSEHEAPDWLLTHYAELVKRIGKSHPVVMLYGSYFSVCLMRYVADSGLAGVCHGLEYGEDRAVIPAVGGLPVSKFYYPEIHKRVRFPDAFKMARPFLDSSTQFLEHVCNCRTCQQVMSSDTAANAFALYGKSHPVTFKRRFQVVTLNYPDTDTRERCVQHYMWNKHKEFREPGLSLDRVVTQLREAHKRHVKTLGLSEMAHCQTWADVLEARKR